VVIVIDRRYIEITQEDRAWIRWNTLERERVLKDDYHPGKG
jgi:hypothetical protein